MGYFGFDSFLCLPSKLDSQFCHGSALVAGNGQFIGHRIEGKKPSFFKDVQFLLVGPAWLLSRVFRNNGQRY